MFVGEFSCLLVWAGMKLWGRLTNKTDEEGDDGQLGPDGVPLSPTTRATKKVNLEKRLNPFLIAIPASCDVCGSTLMFIGLTQTSASVY